MSPRRASMYVNCVLIFKSSRYNRLTIVRVAIKLFLDRSDNPKALVEYPPVMSVFFDSPIRFVIE